jgi:hypothetical protein
MRTVQRLLNNRAHHHQGAEIKDDEISWKYKRWGAMKNVYKI